METAKTYSLLEPTDGEYLMERVQGGWRRMRVREVKANEVFLRSVPRKFSIATSAVGTIGRGGEANTHIPFPVTMMTIV